MATATSYVYDGNGNATTDGRNNKTFTYNILNLPATVSSGPGYTYDALGNKLTKASTVTTQYVNGIQYTGSTIDIIRTEEGIARNNSGTYSYEYDLKDHLGNVRTTIYKNPSTGLIEVLQRDDYYPFGKQRSVTANTNKHLYNGKELQEELGQYDYGARFYDPEVGRWNVVDPKATNYYPYSPYIYVGNNPLRRTDPNGMDWWDDVKKVAKDAAASVTKAYNDAATSTAKTYNETVKAATEVKDKAVAATVKAAKSTQAYVKENKAELLSTAKSMQKVGDGIAVAGGAIAVGTAVTGVGGVAGSVIAGTGGIVSFTGALLEGSVKFISGDTSGAIGTGTGEAAWEIVGTVASQTAGKYIPGGGPAVREMAKSTATVIENLFDN